MVVGGSLVADTLVEVDILAAVGGSLAGEGSLGVGEHILAAVEDIPGAGKEAGTAAAGYRSLGPEAVGILGYEAVGILGWVVLGTQYWVAGILAGPIAAVAGMAMVGPRMAADTVAVAAAAAAAVVGDSSLEEVAGSRP